MTLSPLCPHSDSVAVLALRDLLLDALKFRRIEALAEKQTPRQSRGENKAVTESPHSKRFALFKFLTRRL